MNAQQTQISIPERRDDEPPATADQLQRIRKLATGRSLQGYRFDYRKLGHDQAATVLQQLQAMTDQPTPTPARKQGPGCIASLAKGTTALIVWALVLAGVAGGASLIYWQVNRTPAPTDTAQNDSNDNAPQGTPDSPSDRPDNRGSTGSTIFEGLGASDSPNTPTPTPNTPDRSTDTPDPNPQPVTPPSPTIDRDLINQLAGLEEMLVKLSQFTRNDFAANIRDQSSQAMIKKLADYPKALAALDQADPTLSLRIQAVIDAFGAPTLDGSALRDDIKSIRAAIDKLQ